MNPKVLIKPMANHAQHIYAILILVWSAHPQLMAAHVQIASTITCATVRPANTGVVRLV